MISWLHAKFFHDRFEFFSIVFGIGTEHWKIAKESDIIYIIDLVWIHASQAAHSIKVVVTPPVHIAIPTGTNYARMCLLKLVIGCGSGATAGFRHKFSGTQGQAPPPMTPSCAELAVPISAAVNVPVIVT